MRVKCIIKSQRRCLLCLGYEIPEYGGPQGLFTEQGARNLIAFPALTIPRKALEPTCRLERRTVVGDEPAEKLHPPGWLAGHHQTHNRLPRPFHINGAALNVRGKIPPSPCFCCWEAAGHRVSRPIPQSGRCTDTVPCFVCHSLPLYLCAFFCVRWHPPLGKARRQAGLMLICCPPHC